MSCDPRHKILFEPVKIGPLTAKNRFYQVPHCTGMGWQRPRMLAAMRGVKAEGGWAVVNTEFCSIHPSSDDLPYVSTSLWDQDDVKTHRWMTDAIHAQDALAGAELWYGGARTHNFMTREISMDTDCFVSTAGDPFQSRAMDKADICQFRQWHREAAQRAKDAGFDILYVYATHGYLLSHFLSASTNRRSDEYGGSLENRTRLVRELIEDTKEVAGDRCAVAVRFSADSSDQQADGSDERQDMFALLAELPDLWDINIKDYSKEMGVSRFHKEGGLEPLMTYIKTMTTKPVVTVGRFTSPDSMADQVKRGVIDMIGAARPSIADPFLPRKIEEGRADEIRECIGCNICYVGDGKGVPIRCTQNPTMGEEWRRGWHPERIAPKASDDLVLVVGAGPAGLEATRALGQRGYQVMLAEARRELGGRVTLESALPGLSEWSRVRDHRVQQIEKMPNVTLYRESRMTHEDVLAVEPQQVVIATGADWARDGFGRSHPLGMSGLRASSQVFTPDDIMSGNLPQGRVLIFDDDHYYMASVLAQKLVEAGCDVAFATPADKVCSWGGYTGEQGESQRRLMLAGVKLYFANTLQGYDGAAARLRCVYSGAELEVACDGLLLVTARRPRDQLYKTLREAVKQGECGPIKGLRRIGDCEAPAIIAAAVYAGHRCAREMNQVGDDFVGDRRDRHLAASPALII